MEVYAPFQCYPGDNITVRAKIEALEGVKNASVTMLLWGAKAEGHSPWGTSYSVIEVADFPAGSIEDKTYSIIIPSDIDPGLTYGMLSLDWSIYRSSSWEDQWDKASFRATYVKNRDYEELVKAYSELQSRHDSVLNDMQDAKTWTYALLVTTIALAVSTTYVATRKTYAKKPKGERK